ncbi:MAG: hypothetical protein E6K18_05845 [Methanobacteriota archaeon]|nr:MAG: hypothetical protein E6K18_05845 [Euryarchaeota archaeon]
MVRAKKPARKRDGRLGPPQGWPKDPEKYGDPLNWKYPVHSPFHARAARRYFNDPANRAKYDESEQAYVDKKINDALSKFGVAAKIRGGVEEREAGIIERDLPVEKPVEDMDLEELLGVFLGADRLTRAKGIDASLVRFTKRGSTILAAEVKEYVVTMDLLNKTIYHDCTDWTQNRMKAKLFCKHVGRFFFALKKGEAEPLLRRMLFERETWVFDVA